jgi:hypothetical protein
MENTLLLGSFFKHLFALQSTDILTFIGILLAYIAYQKSVVDKYDSWKSLLQSFLVELKAQELWLSGEYAFSQDKMWYSPNKIIYKISFESAKEIIRRGISDSNVITPKLANEIAFFNERVEAFDQLLNYQKLTISGNPFLSAELQNYLVQKGIANKRVKYSTFVNSIEKLSSSKNQDELAIYSLASRLFFINCVVHNELIGNAKDSSGLHSMHESISKKLNLLLKDYDSRKPFYIKHPILIVVLSIIVFYFITLFPVK